MLSLAGQNSTKVTDDSVLPVRPLESTGFLGDEVMGDVWLLEPDAGSVPVSAPCDFATTSLNSLR